MASPEPRTGITLEEVTSSEGLQRLHSEWADLWERCPSATPFQHPEWQIPWWRHLGEGDLRALAFCREGRLVGLAPFYLYTQPDGARREVFLIGIGTSDYLDVLFAPGFEEEGVARAFAYLEAQRADWEVCHFPQLPPGSALRSAPVPDGWQDLREAGEPCPALDLPESAAQLSHSLPPRMAHNLRYARRRAERCGALQFESATADNVHELFDALLQLHGARWATRGQSGVLAEEKVRRAHREALPGLLRADLLRLYALRLDGRIIACFYGFADLRPCARRVFYYLGGFDPEYSSISPGALLIEHAMQEAVRAGVRVFDFLRGREDYKYRWGASDRPTYRRRLRRRPE